MPWFLSLNPACHYLSACSFIVMLLNYFTISLFLFHEFFFLSLPSPIASPSRLVDFRCVCFDRALSIASVRTATRESSARNSMPATTDLVATTAPAPTSDRGVKDATSHAPALQVRVCMCGSMCASRLFRWSQGPRCVYSGAVCVAV